MNKFLYSTDLLGKIFANNKGFRYVLYAILVPCIAVSVIGIFFILHTAVLLVGELKETTILMQKNNDTQKEILQQNKEFLQEFERTADDIHKKAILTKNKKN